MLEESFADHFNSYRESFAEFVQRLTEVPGARWDHWWIAEVQQPDGTWWPGGGLVADLMPATARAGEGTYLEYLGVHRSARGLGIAKALLHAAIRSEEHTSELQSRGHLVCRLLLEKKKNVDYLK